MPELPEVETTRRGIAPAIEGGRITAVLVREPRLRWPVADDLAQRLVGTAVARVERRAKYLILRCTATDVLLHLGMSGSLRILDATTPAGVHDHLDFVFGAHALRLNDPRRFGSVHLAPHAEDHPLLSALGPEPLSDAFTGRWLHARARGRRVAVKSFLMDQRVVVGVGNIYANEALFQSGIDPHRGAGRISRARYDGLVDAVRDRLRLAITAGGTTLRDFSNADGKPGYFAQDLQAYGREGLPCVRCTTPLLRTVLGQRATVHCPRCQR